MHPFYEIRALGGALYLTGALLMAWNIWKTLRDAPREAAPAARSR